MQGFNRYYPPDYDPDKHSTLNSYHGKHALGKRAHKIDQGILVVRFELPFNIWCGTCHAHIGQGVRYNAEKQKVGNYHSTPILAFRFKCHLCQGRIEIRTDPQNTRYVVTEGAKQKNEEWDPEENGHMVIDNAASTSTAPPDPFASLEKTVTQRAAAQSTAERLHALESHNASRWSDPFSASRALRANFRDKKARIVRSEDRAEEVRRRFGLADERVSLEAMRTPQRGSREAEEEGRAWDEARREMERVRGEIGRKRQREEESVGRASSSSASSPALKALHSRLSLATALKRDPFSSALASSSPARPTNGSNPGGASTGAGIEGLKVKRKP
ncbi:CWC16 protein [Rhodotorula diobovata]|uniref:CWC16 protein n=1 Tax=Rhodotorula diobovata TaxID=5288 RepID=A0A5C5FLY3_9BASI|nr:CWC16 protein [Rhodotorula diobovata]